MLRNVDPAMCPGYRAAGLSAESDQALNTFSKRVQADTVKAACNAIGACPLPKTPSSPEDAGAPPSSPASAPASVASGSADKPKEEDEP